MSAKGRGADVVSDEFYPTPAWCTRRILEALDSHPGFHRNGVWLEPCVGDGAIASVVQQVFAGAQIYTGDIRPVVPLDCARIHRTQGFREWSESCDVVNTNPPFSLAEPLIDHFLPRCDWLILLLRSSFKLVNASGRNYRNNMPDEYKLPQRPEFVASLKCRERAGCGSKNQDGCGWSAKLPITAHRPDKCPSCGSPSGRFIQTSTTDASEYSWFVWTPERGRDHGITRVLPDTSPEERRAT
jgi:hypothetical protein